MNRSYNHIKHLVDNTDIVKSNIHRPGCHWRHNPKHHVNQLDDKQRHTGFDYYEYDMLKFGIPSWAQFSFDRSTSSLDFQEHREDLEHDQARH